MAVAHVDHFEGPSDNILALFGAEVWIPLIGNECKAEVLREASDNVVLFDQCSIKIYAG